MNFVLNVCAKLDKVITEEIPVDLEVVEKTDELLAKVENAVDTEAMRDEKEQTCRASILLVINQTLLVLR